MVTQVITALVFAVSMALGANFGHHASASSTMTQAMMMPTPSPNDVPGGPGGKTGN